MRISVRNVDLREVAVRTRFPFRYGIATLTEVPYIIVVAQVVIDGRCCQGLAADILPPKWFTKQPDEAFTDELDAMRKVIRRTALLAVDVGAHQSVYDWWQSLLSLQYSDDAIKKLPPLLTSFGASLLERSVIDSYCRRFDTTFHQALISNQFGIRLSDFHAELAGLEPRGLLPATPAPVMAVRHTVGLGDPLTVEDVPLGERLHDGLPHSLEDCIRRYGLRYFKIKLPADTPTARERLLAVFCVLDKLAPDSRFTLDGNECFDAPERFVEHWSNLCSHPIISKRLKQGLLLVEQPIHRDSALSAETGRELARWKNRPPIIIDESDAELGSFAQALQIGYDGTSHKNCKGVFKGIAHACLVRYRNSQDAQRRLFLTGEDLMNIGPIALLQDLAVGASIGLRHMERNGHHYVAGLQPFPSSIQEAVARYHGDLYHVTSNEAGQSFTRLVIQNGDIRMASVNRAAFGYSLPIDPSDFGFKVDDENAIVPNDSL